MLLIWGENKLKAFFDNLNRWNLIKKLNFEYWKNFAFESNRNEFFQRTTKANVRNKVII